MLTSSETIFAPITALGQAAVSLVRVSGEQTSEIIRALIKNADHVLSHPRELKMTTVWDLLSGETFSAEQTKGVLDYCLVAYFKAPKSFTGEDCLEFNLHGSSFILKRLLENLTYLGARPANPGEFSERAYLNGLIDLTQAEAVADLIAAETEAQARLASEQLAGKLAEAVSLLGEPMRDILAEIEAYIDFPEEGIEPLTHAAWRRVIEEVLGRVEKYLSSFSTGKILREGVRVVLAGLPNAGKSSLLNFILGEQRAIVTSVPGTTRDTIEEHLSIDGLLVRLTDTAGIPDEKASRKLDQVEEIGVQRSWLKIREADIVIFVFDGNVISEESLTEFQKVNTLNKSVIAVVNKVDLITKEQSEIASAKICALGASPPLFISAQTGTGVDELFKQVKNKALSQKQSGSILIANERHFQALQKAGNFLSSALVSISSNSPPELVSMDIRSALNALNEIIGLTHTEEILGRIFSKFCIGK